MKYGWVSFLIIFFLANCSVVSSVEPTSSETSPKEVYSVSVSPDGEMLAVSASYGTQVYKVADGKMLFAFENKISRFQGVYSQIAWSPDSSNIAVGTLNFGVRIWEVATWRLLTEFGDETAYTSAVFSHPGFAWSPNSSYLMLGINQTGKTLEDYESGRILIWDRSANTWDLVTDKIQFMSILAWNSDDQELVLANGKIFDINSGDIVEEADRYDFVIWSPDGKHFYGQTDLGGALYDRDRNEYEFSICCYPEVAWSMDGRHFAATEENGNEINIWDSKENKLIYNETQGDRIYAFTWNPEGELLIAGLRDGKSVVWNMSTKEVVLELQ